MDSWAKLEEILPPDQREQLAKLLLDALQSPRWQTIELEIREHRLHDASVTLLHVLKKATLT